MGRSAKRLALTTLLVKIDDDRFAIPSDCMMHLCTQNEMWMKLSNALQLRVPNSGHLAKPHLKQCGRLMPILKSKRFRLNNYFT